MYCLKCGKNARDVFCDECQLEMKDYPIKPDTPVSLPDREAYFARKKATQPKKKISIEMKYAKLRKVNKFLLILWGITALALAGAILVGFVF